VFGCIRGAQSTLDVGVVKLRTMRQAPRPADGRGRALSD
jgi:hypothetical protein